jgi:cell division protein FtsL
MTKLHYILNILALIACSVSAWKIFSDRAERDFLNQEIAKIKTEISDMSLAVEEAKKGQKDKLSREKRKNRELEETKQDSEAKIADLTRRQGEMRIVFEENAEKHESLASSIQNTKVSLAGIDKEIEMSRASLRSISLIVPSLQDSIISIETEISEKKSRKSELGERILSYDKETEILKKHYNLTTSALQKDFYERPWLERGERVSVSFSSLNLESGIIMLPIGKDHGLERSMRFAVRAKGESICQIRIKDVSYSHCVAMILPLLGNPTKLREFKYLDLIHL